MKGIAPLVMSSGGASNRATGLRKCGEQAGQVAWVVVAARAVEGHAFVSYPPLILATALILRISPILSLMFAVSRFCLVK